MQPSPPHTDRAPTTAPDPDPPDLASARSEPGGGNGGPPGPDATPLPPQAAPLDPEAPIVCTTFAHAKTSAKQARSINWRALVEELAQPIEATRDDKLALPMLSPAEWRPDARTKHAKDVERVWFACLDFDHVDGATLDRVCASAEGLASILYTTWSHPKEHAATGLWSFRLLVPFSRPVAATEWPAFAPRLWARLGQAADPKCVDCNRAYFAPAVRKGDPLAAHAVTLETDGAALDVDAILGLPEPPAGWKAQAAPVLTRAELEDYAAKLARRRRGTAKEAAAAIKAALRGQAYAVTHRDNVTWSLAVYLARQWPDHEPSTIAVHFAASIEAMQAMAHDPSNPAPTVETFCEKLARCQRQVREERDEGAAEQLEAQKTLLRAAWNNGRDTPYTAAEINSYAEAAGVSRADFQRQWIIQAGPSYYLFKGGQYSWPRMDCEFLSSAFIELSPATTAGVTVHKLNAQGELRPKKPTELVADYGTIAREVIADLNAQRSTYDAKTYTMIEAPCPLRPLAPLEPDSPDADERLAFERINEWLRLLGGPTHDKLLDWIALAPRLDRPIAALYFGGTRSAGKTLFALGMARLWRDGGPTPLAHLFDDFQEDVLKCPLILADEKMPEDYRRRSGSSRLRELVQSVEMKVNRKFRVPLTLKGCFRFVLAANNQHLLESNEFLTPDDIDAIVDRILFVKATERPAQYLEGLGWSQTAKFLEKDYLARFALYMQRVRRVDAESRFAVTGEASEMHRSITMENDTISSICQWLASYLQEPAKLDAQGRLLVRVLNNKLYVNPSEICRNWDLYETNCKPPLIRRAGRELAKISESERQKMPRGDGGRAYYRPIKIEILKQWCKETLFCPPEEIDRALSTDTEIPGARRQGPP